MKKLIALIAGTAVMLSMSMTSFAAFTDEIKANEDGTYTAALAADAATANAGKQTTIVAYKGDTISVGSIQYINQDAADSFTFQLKDALTEDVKVVMGGEAIAKQEIGTIKYVAPVTTVALGGTVTGYYEAAAEMPTITVGDYTAVVDADGTWAIEGGVKPGTYAVSATKAYHTSHFIEALEVAEDTTDVALEVYAGDLDESTWIDSDDIMLILADDTYEADDTFDNWDDISYIDIDESTWIDSDDIMIILANYEKEEIWE